MNLKGFSLIETIVAIFILSVGILAVLALFPLGSKTISSSKTMLSADLLAQQKMEEMLGMSYGDVDVGEVTEESLPAPFENFSRKTRITYIDSSSLHTEITEDKNLKKIEVTVSWNSALLSLKKDTKISSIISKK